MPPRPRLPVLHVLNLAGFSSPRSFDILSQLRIEEAIFRADPLQRNWLILNQGMVEHGRKVVFGLGDSRRPETLCNVTAARKDGVQLIKRFSGGGTVFVDENTTFLTFICNEDILVQNEGLVEKEVLNFPRPIMDWTGQVYRGGFDRIMGTASHGFALQENDYVFGKRKFGGNAQSISKDRWLHHTSNLWTYDSELMGKYLLMPEKRPDYREDRTHEAFLCGLSEILPSGTEKDSLSLAILEELGERGFALKHVTEEEFEKIVLQDMVNTEHRRGNKVL